METSRRAGPLHVLLIEDSEADIALIRTAFGEVQRPHSPVELHVARDGAQARAALASDPRIALVLLDGGLPGEDGLHWLASLKAHDDVSLRRLPVVMLSGSDTEEQIRGAYHAHASAYLIKPSDPDGLRQMVGALVQFWGQVARLPNRL